MNAKRDPDWSWHCADLAVDHVRASTGRDLWAELGGAPRSPREAADLYRKLGVRSLEGAVSRAMGEPVDARRAMRGDLVLVRSGEMAALGICRGEVIECADNVLPMSRAECAWRLRA